MRLFSTSCQPGHFLFFIFLLMQYMSEKMMKQEPDQALPITAGMITTTAFFAMLWCFADGWMREPGWESIGLPGLFLNADMRSVVSFTQNTNNKNGYLWLEKTTDMLTFAMS